jgi:CRP/FNR family transcriptional regulator
VVVYDSSMESAIQPSCRECILRGDRTFCDLPADALQAFDQIKAPHAFPRGANLFREGQMARGIFLLCAGRVRLTVSAESGRRLTVRVCGPGEVLGLSATLAGGAYEVSAEALEDCRVAMVKRKELVRFLHDHRDACMHAVQLLSQDLHGAYDRVRAVGLARTRRPHSQVARVH